MVKNDAHISNHLGRLIQRWTQTNPNAIRAIKKVSDNDEGFLLLDSEQKLKHIEAYRLKNFKGALSGQNIDLTKFK